MACGEIGTGTLVWAGQTLTFRSEDGITEDGPTWEPVKTTVFGATAATFCQGSVGMYGTVSVTGVGSIEAATGEFALTITYPLAAGGSTAATRIGTAFIIAAPTETKEDDEVITKIQFQWADKPAFTAAT